MTTLAHRAGFAALVLLVALLAAVVTADPAGAAVRVAYRPPVTAPVSEPFRAPTTPYGPGHRGIEYASERGTVVGAAASGTVVFAGAVAGTRYVTLRHADGLRTTVGPLDEVDVAPGQRVVAGERLGIAAGPLLFTVRRGTEYLDPAPLLVAGPPRVHLVPDATPWPQPRATR